MIREEIPIPSDDPYPNNPGESLIHYSRVFGEDSVRPEDFERRFASKGWGGMWRNGVFPFHHFHSNSHEALGCYGGEARIQFGGPSGPVVGLSAGDAVFVPAGVAHCRLSASKGFHVVGAYPAGFSPDICEGNEYPMDELRRRI